MSQRPNFLPTKKPEDLAGENAKLTDAITEAICALEDGRRGDALKVLRAASGKRVIPPDGYGGGSAA